MFNNLGETGEQPTQRLLQQGAQTFGQPQQPVLNHEDQHRLIYSLNKILRLSWINGCFFPII
jgi:hypothetical protein